MPESTDQATGRDRLVDRVRAAEPGLTALIGEAERAWAARTRDPEATPGWRPFEDQFPTFYQFTNRPR
jgi:hypothetical protein